MSSRKFAAVVLLSLGVVPLVAQLLTPSPYVLQKNSTVVQQVVGSTQALIEFRYSGATKGYVGACTAGPCILNDAGNIGLYVPLGTQNVIMASGDTQMLHQTSATACASSASPSVCAAASSGLIAMAAGSATLVVNTTQVRAGSQILVIPDSSLGTALSVTCNTTIPTISVSARTAATSFTVTASAAPVTNPLCMSYHIIN